MAVYRILQEHLTNILKHAGAQMVSITLNVEDGMLKLVVSDNGSGFDVAQKRSGIGITNMITRAESVNGTLKLLSSPGTGCKLIAQFPLG
jgi:signal transduction histidine kinase